MQRFYLTSDINPSHFEPILPNVMSIGNFDGVHLGHQAMLTQTVALAKSLAQKSAVMVFEPQPKEFFDPQSAPARLMSLDEKCQKLQSLGIDYVFVASFNERFAKQSADEFCQLLRQLKVSTLVLGDDFRFGAGRQGDKELLISQGFGVHSLDSVLSDDKRVSSTYIRSLLSLGKLDDAKVLLGEPYAITGQVVHGDKIGRLLDFPTANIALNRNTPAVHGVFGVEVSLMDGEFDPSQGGISHKPNTLFGCANIGKRPSVDNVTHDWRLEVHLPTFHGDLYGCMLKVTFLHYLHDEKKYANLDELKQGIAHDIEQLTSWYQSYQSSLSI